MLIALGVLPELTCRVQRLADLRHIAAAGWNSAVDNASRAWCCAENECGILSQNVTFDQPVVGHADEDDEDEDDDEDDEEEEDDDEEVGRRGGRKGRDGRKRGGRDSGPRYTLRDRSRLIPLSVQQQQQQRAELERELRWVLGSRGSLVQELLKQEQQADTSIAGAVSTLPWHSVANPLHVRALNTCYLRRVPYRARKRFRERARAHHGGGGGHGGKHHGGGGGGGGGGSHRRGGGGWRGGVSEDDVLDVEGPGGSHPWRNVHLSMGARKWQAGGPWALVIRVLVGPATMTVIHARLRPGGEALKDTGFTHRALATAGCGLQDAH